MLLRLLLLVLFTFDTWWTIKADNFTFIFHFSINVFIIGLLNLTHHEFVSSSSSCQLCHLDRLHRHLSLTFPAKGFVPTHISYSWHPFRLEFPFAMLRFWQDLHGLFSLDRNWFPQRNIQIFQMLHEASNSSLVEPLRFRESHVGYKINKNKWKRLFIEFSE